MSDAKTIFGDEAKMRGKMVDVGKTSAELDAARRRTTAYEYLCHLEEARKWLEACVKEEMPPAVDMEESLRNGVVIGKLANFFAPRVVPLNKLYDTDLAVYKERGLVYRHTDNIAQWLRAMASIKLPQTFYPTTTDMYDKKNMPRVIYCIHALSRYLYHLGIAPLIEDLQGTATFTEEEISAMDKQLAELNIQMPKFNKIGGILAKEISEDAAAVHALVLSINRCIELQEPSEKLLSLLKTPALALQLIDDEAKEEYRSELIACRLLKCSKATSNIDDPETDVYDRNLTKAEIQTTITTTNNHVAARAAQQALDDINKAVAENDLHALGVALVAPAAAITAVDTSRVSSYMSSLSVLFATSNPLTRQQIQGGIDEANMVEDILHCVHDNRDTFLSSLRRVPVFADIIDDTVVDAYRHALKTAIASNKNLSLQQIKEILLEVNEFVNAMRTLNKAIDNADAEKTFIALQHQKLNIAELDENGIVQYQISLSNAKKTNQRDLTRDEVQREIHQTNLIAEENAKHAAAIFAINDAIRGEDLELLWSTMTHADAHIKNTSRDALSRYQTAMKSSLLEKEQSRAGIPIRWKKFTTEDGKVYYYNKDTKETQWVPPPEMLSTMLSAVEIQAIVNHSNQELGRANYLKAHEPIFVNLQAIIRGKKIRQQYLARRKYLSDHANEIIAIQRIIRGCFARRAHILRWNRFHENTDKITMLQAHIRGIQQLKRYRDRLAYFRAHETEVIRIQAAFKGMKARRQYKNLTKVVNPPVATVRKFVHLLDQNDADFAEELAVQQLKEKVVKEIKNNHQLESEVNDMDIKIGLLVRNRIELQDVVKQSKKLKKARARGEEVLPENRGEGLKSLTKEARQKLESYQNLFYLLQTNPRYLATLVYIDTPFIDWSPNKTSTFLHQVIQSMYNYASNAREQYLMLQLFRTALKQEITEKVYEVQDFITGNPTFIKLVIGQHRGQHSGTYLSDTLGSLIRPILADDTQNFSTDPVDVYQRWIYQTEATTGEKSTLPYDVDREHALEHEFVRQSIQQGVNSLIKTASGFLTAIISALPSLPYGLRYIAMKLKQDLLEKFAGIDEDEVLKIVGNLLYYRYVNPAIASPEAFDVIEMRSAADMTAVQRRNLGSISKLLQFAASNQNFEGDSPYILELNKFLNESWLKFRQYFQRASEVESAEEHFNIDEYSDVTQVSKPTILISPHEIHYTHLLLSVNLDVVAPEEHDPLRVILADLGPITVPQEQPSNDQISLNLTNKFEVPEADDSSIRTLLIRTKRLIVEIIRFQQGKNLVEILDTPATPAEEYEHRDFALKKMEENKQLASEGQISMDDLMKKQTTIIKGDGLSDILTMEQIKQQIRINADLLEKENFCSKANNYQDLLNSVAQDIRNQRIYRRQRKQELAKLKSALLDLERKKQFYAEQSDYYDNYIESCMQQLTRKPIKKSGFFSKKIKDGQGFGTFKYTGTKLKEKGVLISIDGVSPMQLKAVTIEISSQQVGVFHVEATFLGNKLQGEDFNLQDLLQMQYEGIGRMKIFEQCVVNVNLLIFLINKKFYHQK